MEQSAIRNKNVGISFNIQEKLTVFSCQFQLQLSSSYTSAIDQFRYIKIQSQTMNLRTRLWGINPTNSVFIPQSLVVRSSQLIKPNYLVILPPTQHHSFFRNLPPLFYCFNLNFNISKLVYLSKLGMQIFVLSGGCHSNKVSILFDSISLSSGIFLFQISFLFIFVMLSKFPEIVLK